jgi:hypothetical protein
MFPTPCIVAAWGGPLDRELEGAHVRSRWAGLHIHVDCGHMIVPMSYP